MIMQIYQRAFSSLMKQPVRLIGLSLFGSLLISLGSILFSPILALSMSVSLLLNAALAQIFLRSYRGETCNTQDMFINFKNGVYKRTLGGMAWRKLWLFIFFIIPIAGPIIYIIKNYQYVMTPYILMNEESVGPMDAIKVSKERMRGNSLKLFGAEILAYVAVSVVSLILSLLARIPYIGVLFGIILFLFLICVVALMPLFLGLVRAAFYEEVSGHETAAE